MIAGGAAAQARADLMQMVQAEPRSAEAQHLLGKACERLGDLAAAEAAFRAAAALNRRSPGPLCDLGALQARLGQDAAAEKSLRAALALDRRHDPAAVEFARLLNRRRRHGEALQVTTPLAGLRSASEALLAAHAEALRGLDRQAERLTACERAASLFPQSVVARHNLGSALGDLHRYADSRRAAEAAFAMGLDAPETWAVLARARQGEGDFDGAETAFQAALVRRPGMADVHRDLSQLLWMRSGDVATAAERLNQALAADPGDAALQIIKAQLLDCAGEAAEAYRALAAAAAAQPDAAALQTAAARAALRLDPASALAHARAATTLAPENATALTALCEALLAAGEAQAAATILERLRRERPLDQHLLAYQATAWRLLGDPRYPALYDYDRLVSASRIAPPHGWASLAAYLSDLAAALERYHGPLTHPFGQSLRLGSQTSADLSKAEDPALRGFFEAIAVPIHAHLAALGPGKDPLRRRSQGGYAVAGAWSVRLRPGGGHHVDHVHQQGWLSSAFYVDLPPAVGAGGREGWIKFGEPGVPTAPALAAEHAVKPEPGLLVLFPSYMWHGTLPFGGDRPRLSMAFDLVPAPRRRP